jgi:hypothetical protein
MAIEQKFPSNLVDVIRSGVFFFAEMVAYPEGC